jgi:hypothetical protein
MVRRPPITNRLLPRALRALAYLLAATAFALVLGEALVRVTNVDWRYAKRLLYYQSVDLKNRLPDPAVNVRYRLRPGVVDYGLYRVGVNSLGYRGPERPAEKPPGVFRVLCVGGSNVYGLSVSNDETWPAQLEKRLNAARAGRFEVWNAGLPAYVGVQMVIAAEEALGTIRPDLVLVALSNIGYPAFLAAEPVEPYFDREPTLWFREIPPSYFRWPAWLSLETKARLVQRVRLYRAALLGIMAATRDDVAWYPENNDAENIDAVRGFVQRHRGDVRIAMFVCPGCQIELPLIERYYNGLDVPVLVLSAKGRPGEYRRIHPPAHVYEWYGEKVAQWLVREGIVPTGEARIRGPR